MNIREEQPGDAAQIRRVNLAAFETNTEAVRASLVKESSAAGVPMSRRWSC
jgi:predicted N-acetyltransferase YhbS